MDQSLLLIINQTATHPVVDRVMAIASSMDFWLPMLVTLGVLWFLFGGFRARAMIICAALSIGIVDGILVNNAKKLIARPRPAEVLVGVRRVDLANAKPRLLAAARPLRIEYSAPKKIAKTGRSLPSGHTANNFAFATVLTFFYRRWGWIYYLPAALIAYSRVYVGSHWPSDVLLSACFSVAATCLILKGLEWLWTRHSGHIFPKWHASHPHLVSP